MKKIVFFSFIFFVIILVGCNNPDAKITSEQAESIVIEKYSEDIKINSVDHKGGQYVVNWEDEEDCTSGITRIDDQNGKIIEGEVTICD